MATNVFSPTRGRTFVPNQEVAETPYADLVGMSQLERGLRSSLINTDAGGASSDYWKARAAGDTAGANTSGLRMQQLTQEAGQYAPRVQSIGDIHGLKDTGDWAAGVIGSLPVSVVPAVAGGLVGGLGGARFGLAAAGSMLGSTAAMQPQMANAARLQQQQAEAQGAPALDPQQVITSTDNQGLMQAGLESIVPSWAARSMLGQGAKAALNKPISSAVQRIGRDVAVDSAAAVGSEHIAMNFETQRNPNRDTRHDQMRYLDAAAGEAIGGVAMGAMGHTGDVAHTMLGTGAQLGADAAGYAARAGQKGAQAAWNARPQSWDEAAVMVGEGAADLHNKAEDMVTRWTQKGRDADTDVLLTPQKGMAEDELRADDANKHTATANLMAKLSAEPDSFPDYVHAAAAQYAQGSKTMDSWRPVADAVNDMHRSESILSGANDLLSEKLAPVAEALGKGAADVMNAKDDALTAYNGKREADGRQNAMTPAMGRKIANERDDFSPILEESLAPFTGLKTEEGLTHALPTLGHAMRNWAANGFSMKKDGELVVPKTLLDMFDDPAEAIAVTTKLMHEQGLIDDGALAKRDEVLRQLDVMQTARKEVSELVSGNLTPTARRQYSTSALRSLAEYYTDKVRGTDLDAAVQGQSPSSALGGAAHDAGVNKAVLKADRLMKEAEQHFGPRARTVLDALKAKDEAAQNAISGRDRRSGGEQQANTRVNEYGDMADNVGPNVSTDLDAEGLAQITSSNLDPEAGAPTVKYHHYSESRNDKATGGKKPPVPFQVGGVVKNKPDRFGNEVPDTQHDAAAEKRIAEMHGLGGVEVKRQGYMDYLREKRGNDAEGLMNDVQDALRDKIDVLAKLQAKTKRTVKMEDGSTAVMHDPAEKVLNDNYYVLREEAQREKGEATNVTADEFGREGAKGQIIGNKWAEDVGKDGEYGTTAHGRIWLERTGSDGKPREFATSASRVIERTLKARKTEGRVDESSGLAGQKTALMQGLASLLAAAHPETEAGKWGKSTSDKSGTGAAVLSGRVGYKETPDGPVQWLVRGQEFPDSLRMYSKGGKDGKTYGDANDAVKTAAGQKILTDGKTLLKSLSTRLANMGPSAKGRGYVIEDIEDLQSALEARDVRSVDVSLRKSETYELGREDDGVDTASTVRRTFRTEAEARAYMQKGDLLQQITDRDGTAATPDTPAIPGTPKWVVLRTQHGASFDGVTEIGADTYEAKPVSTTTVITRDARKNLFGSKKAALEHAKTLAEQGVELRVVKRAESALGKSGEESTRAGRVGVRAKDHWVIERTAKDEARSHTGLPTEIGEMGKVTSIRSRHEDGESDGERNADELGEALHTFDTKGVPVEDKAAIAKRTEFVVNALMDGVPSFVAMARKLSPERREALLEHLQGMLDGKWPDATRALRASEAPRPGQATTPLAPRARVALIELGKMQGAAKAPAAPKGKATFGKLEGYTNHSGAARGADTMWDLIGRRFGVTEHNHYRAEGNTTVPPDLKQVGTQAVVLTKEQLDEGYKMLDSIFGKPTQKPNQTANELKAQALARDLKARNYFQVKNADAVFAIAELRTGKGDVKGGTNAAVQMAIHMDKPVHVWDTGSMTWHKWDGDKFVPSTTPTLTKNFAGIGTRDVENYNVPDPTDSTKWVPRAAYKGKSVENAARQAITDVYRKTFESEGSRNNAQRVESRIDMTATAKTYAYGVADKHMSDVADASKKLHDGAIAAWNAGKTKDDFLGSFRASAQVARLVHLKSLGGNGLQQAIDLTMNTVDQIFSNPLDKTLESTALQRLKTAQGYAPAIPLKVLMADVAVSSLPDGFKAVAKAVAKVVGDTRVYGEPGDHDGTSGWFEPALGEIHVSIDAPTSKAHTILHEGIHAATLRAVMTDPELHNAAYALMAHIADKNPKLASAYGFTNTLEFFAEGLSNVNLQRELFKIPASSAVEKYLGKTLANAWEAFVALVSKALNLPAGHESALRQLIELGGRAMKSTASQGRTSVNGAEMNEFITRPLVPLAKIESAMQELERSPLLSATDRAGIKSGLTEPARQSAENGKVAHATALAIEVARQLLPSLAARAKGRVSLHDLQAAVQRVVQGAGMFGNNVTPVETRFNKQDPHAAFGTATSSPATKEEQERFHADIMRRLGPQMKSGLVEVLMGKDAKGKEIMLSGKWEKGAIYASVYSRNLGQIGAHEAFHEFFDRMKSEPAAADVMKLLDRAANSPYVVRQLERLLDGEKEALKQIKQGVKNSAEERMAYMFQFHQAGLLQIGPETQNIFAKLAAFFRKVAGLLNDDERADMLLRNFDEGKMQTADAAARVLANSVTARQKMYEGVNNAFKPMMERAGRLVNTAETNLERTGNPVYKEVRRMFKRSVGEDGAQGFLDAKDHQMKLWGNRLATVFEGLDPKDLALAAPYLHTGETPTDPAVKQLVARLKGPNGLMPQMYTYLKEAGIKRWEQAADGIGGEWVPMGKIDHGYFPRAYDTAMILDNVDGFVADMVKFNPDELGNIAAAQNATLAKTLGKDFTPITADDVAKAIANRLINAYGQRDLGESGSSIGFSPFMQSINQRQLHWIHPEMLKKYGDKDVSRILTGYIAQGVKRAEYVRRFGNGGEVLKAKMKEAYEMQLAKMVENKFGVKDVLDKAKKAKPIGDAKSLEDLMKQVVIFNNPTAQKTEYDALVTKALKIAQGAAKDVMAMEGTLGYNISPKKRQFQNSVLVYENMRLLSTSLFSQFIDPLNLLVRGATAGDAWNAYKRGLREVVASIKDDPIKDLDAQIADQVGTTDANHFLAAFGQLHSSQYLGTKFRKANDVMFKYNGMEGFNRGMQVAATRAAINFIKRHVQTPNERSVAYLKELNLTGKDVKVNADGELDYTDPRIQQAIHQWVNGSVLRPNAAQRPAWASDPHYMIFWHMKQFAYTFHDVVLKRALHDYKKFGDMGPAGMLALTYTPVMIATDALKSVMLTGDEPTWMKAGLDSEIHHGAMRAGLLGKFQPFADVTAPHHSVLGLGGPAIEQITEMFTDTPTDSAVNALPGANVWNTIKGAGVVDMDEGHTDN